MNIRRISIAAILIALAAYFASRSKPEPKPEAPPSIPQMSQPVERTELPDFEPEDEGARSIRRRYAVDFSVESLFEGNEGPGFILKGVWTTERLSDGRVAATLSDVSVEGHHMAPAADEAERGLELIVADGVIEGIAFAPRTSAKARRLLSNMATTLWPVVRDEDQYTVEQEDLGGSHRAVYTRTGEASLERSIAEVTGLRGQGGLDAFGTEHVKTGGKAVFEFDGRGLVAADIVDDRSFKAAEQGLDITARVRAKVRRIDAQPVALRAPVPYPPATFSPEVDYAEQAAIRDDVLVDGATLEQMTDELDDALAMPGDDRETHKWRSKALHRLTALIRIDPMVAADIAGQLAQLEAGDKKISFLAGALSSANTADATNALAGILDEDLDPKVRHSVHSNLSLTQAPTGRSINALKEDLDGPAADSAAMALGAQAQRMDVEDEPAQNIVETLMQRYRAARTPGERVAALKALGNSGNPAIVPLLKEATQDVNPTVAFHAVRALRFVPGRDVDALLESFLETPYAAAVIESAAWREGYFWGPKLAEARPSFEDNEVLANAIDQLLRRWGTNDPA